MGRDWYAEKYKDQPEMLAARKKRLDDHRAEAIANRLSKKDMLLDAMLRAATPLAGIVNELADKYRLTESQQRYFLIRLKYKNDAECADALGLSRMTVAMWTRPSVKYPGYNNDPSRWPDFIGAMKEFRGRLGELAGGLMEGLAIKVVERTDELLDATKRNYNAKGELASEDPDYGARAKGIEVVSRWIGKGWNDHQDHSADPGYVQIMNRFNEYVERLAETKRLPQPVVEGEFKVVKDGTG